MKVEGDILTFNTDMIKPLKVCKVNFNPIQSGTGDPSPNNIRPIIGRASLKLSHTGRNIFDFDNSEFVNGEFYNDQGATASSTAYRRLVNYIEVKPNKTYTVQYTKSSSVSTAFTVPLYDENKNFIQRESPISAGKTKGLRTGQFNTTSTTKYVRFSIANATDDAASVQIEEGNIVHDFEQFGNLYDVAFPDGDTVYGGTLDLLTGVLTVNRFAYTEDGSTADQWSVSATTSEINCFTLLKNSLPDTPKNNSTDNLLVNYFKSSSTTAIWNAFIDSNGNFLCYVPSSLIPDINSWETYVTTNPLIFVYELDEPIFLQLTSQQINAFKGANNIWANTGETYVEYWIH